MIAAADIDDPRQFPAAADASADAEALFALALESLGATTGAAADAADAKLRNAMRSLLRGEGVALARTFAASPSVDVTRKLWRELDAA
jgi:hypothetical protein